MFATNEMVDLAKWIFDDTSLDQLIIGLFYFYLNFSRAKKNVPGDPNIVKLRHSSVIISGPSGSSILDLSRHILVSHSRLLFGRSPLRLLIP